MVRSVIAAAMPLLIMMKRSRTKKPWVEKPACTNSRMNRKMSDKPAVSRVAQSWISCGKVMRGLTILTTQMIFAQWIFLATSSLAMP